jgi:pilus assembly protein CpaC
MRNILRITLVLFFIILAGKGLCFAQQASYEEGELITLYIGEIKFIPVNSPTRVAISNPEVADISSISKHEMVVAAKSPGSTGLVWWDNLGQHTLQLQVFLEDMSAVKQRVDALLKNLDLPYVYTRQADSEGKVLLLGKVKTAEDLERIDTSLGELKNKVANLITIEAEEASIEIDVQVLELAKGANKTLGFTYPTSLQITETAAPSVSGAPPFGGWGALFGKSTWTRNIFFTKLDLLVQEGRARILSRPRLVCQSGMEAELLVGGEKPIMTTTVSGDSTGTEIEYKEYGIKLKIIPRVTPEKRIQVSLNVDVSEVGDAEILGSATNVTARAYPLTKRTTSTQLILDNGQTLAISGLIKQKTEEELQKFPWLADIPILGLFFRQRTTEIGDGAETKGDAELVITLTPNILPKTSPASASLKSSTGSGVSKVADSSFSVEKPAITSYTRRVIKRIQENFVYPSEARKKKLQGLVSLSLQINSTGELIEAKIVQSSGSEILDENAAGIIKRISPFPPFPPDIEERELWINIPIAYKLE